jgi:hypothetical protein
MTRTRKNIGGWAVFAAGALVLLALWKVSQIVGEWIPLEWVR